jgi:hypothetical protein
LEIPENRGLVRHQVGFNVHCIVTRPLHLFRRNAPSLIQCFLIGRPCPAPRDLIQVE